MEETTEKQKHNVAPLKVKIAINNLLSRGLMEENDWGKMRYIAGWDDNRVREEIAKEFPIVTVYHVKRVRQSLYGISHRTPAEIAKHRAEQQAKLQERAKKLNGSLTSETASKRATVGQKYVTTGMKVMERLDAIQAQLDRIESQWK